MIARRPRIAFLGGFVLVAPALAGDGPAWSLVQELVASDGGGHLGIDVALSGDTALLAANAAPGGPGQAALLFVGEDPVLGGSGLPFGDGLLCADTNVLRLVTESADAGGEASFGPGLGALGGWEAGDSRYFQAWYRDPVGGPCGSKFNATPGIEARFFP